MFQNKSLRNYTRRNITYTPCWDDFVANIDILCNLKKYMSDTYLLQVYFSETLCLQTRSLFIK